MELSRPLALDRIGPHGVSVTVVATADELVSIARRLMIASVPKLSCSFEVKRSEGGVLLVNGILDAAAEQDCVVTLEPFVQPIHEKFSVHFVPSGSEEPEPEPDAVDQIPYDSSAIDLGEAAVEQLALALDPYPRKPGAALPPELVPEGGAFAGLARLKSGLLD